MHDGILCGPIQGQGQVHVALKVRNSSVFKKYLVHRFNGSWQMIADSLTRGFLMSVLFFVSRDFELGRKLV